MIRLTSNVDVIKASAVTNSDEDTARHSKRFGYLKYFRSRTEAKTDRVLGISSLKVGEWKEKDTLLE